MDTFFFTFFSLFFPFFIFRFISFIRFFRLIFRFWLNSRKWNFTYLILYLTRLIQFVQYDTISLVLLEFMLIENKRGVERLSCGREFWKDDLAELIENDEMYDEMYFGMTTTESGTIEVCSAVQTLKMILS